MGFIIRTAPGSSGGGSSLTQEQVEDFAGAMFAGNTEVLITATYQDVDGTIDLTVENDLSLYDNTTSGFFTTSSDVTFTDITGYDANENLDHTAISVTAGSGLSGGGTIAATRTIDVDIASEALVVAAVGDQVLIADASDTNAIKKVTVQTIVDLATGGSSLTQEEVEDFVGGMLGGTETLITVTYQDAAGNIDFVVDNDLANYSNATSAFYNADTDVDHDATTNFAADAHILHAGVTLTAGSGLAGGGTIAASRTFDVDIDSETLVVAAVGDQVLIADASDTNAIKKVTVQTIVDLAAGGATLTQEQVEDFAGAMFTGNTETLITATYQDVDGTIDLVVDNDLANYSNATSAFQVASDIDTKISTHAGLADPHTVYALESSLATVATSGAYTDLSGLPTLGTAADNAEGDFATAAQGTLADSATQPSDNISTLNNDSGYYDADADVTLTGVTGYIAGEHILHSGVTLTAGDGLSGGGTIAASRTFNVDIASETNVVAATTDEVLIADVSDTDAIKKVTAQSIADLASLSAEFDSAESEGASTTTSVTPSTKVTLSAAVINTNKYRLVWYCEGSDTSTAGTCFVEIYANGTLIAENGLESSDISDIKPYTGFYDYTAAATATQDFRIDYSNIGSGTSTIQRARISIKRIV